MIRNIAKDLLFLGQKDEKVNHLYVGGRLQGLQNRKGSRTYAIGGEFQTAKELLCNNRYTIGGGKRCLLNVT